MAGSRKSLDSEFFQKIFRNFSENSEKFLKNFWKFSEKILKNFWNLSKFEKINAKSLKIAAKQLGFLHFWYLGTAKSNEKLAENFENSSKTARFPSFFNGWQQKISGFRKFSEIFQKFFRNFSEISGNQSSAPFWTSKAWAGRSCSRGQLGSPTTYAKISFHGRLGYCQVYWWQFSTKQVIYPPTRSSSNANRHRTHAAAQLILAGGQCAQILPHYWVFGLEQKTFQRLWPFLCLALHHGLAQCGPAGLGVGSGLSPILDV